MLGGGDAVGRLLEIERANLFLVALDGRREWYRYHHLFGDLLRYELERSEPELIPDLHRRAAEWLAANGAIDDAIRHLLAAGDDEPAAALVAESWRAPFNRGQLATVDRWLDDLPERAVLAEPDLCLARAWVLLDSGRPHEVERWLRGAAARRVGRGGGAARGAHLQARPHREAERVARRGARSRVVRQPARARPSPASSSASRATTTARSTPQPRRSTRRCDSRSAGDNTLARIYALGYLGLVRVEQGDADAARASVAQALELAAEPSASAHFVTAMALLAHGRLDGDDAALEEAVTLARRGAAPVEIAAALLGLGEHRRDPATLAEARGTLATCPDPGRLPKLIEAAELGLRGRRPGPRRQIAGDLSDRELAVLRLFPTDASLREIAGCALRLAEHGEDALEVDLPQARRLDPRRGGRAGPRAGPPLEQDPQRELGRAAAGDEVGGLVEVDVQPCRERDRLLEWIAARRQLREAPANHFRRFDLFKGFELGCGHAVQTGERPRCYRRLRSR